MIQLSPPPPRVYVLFGVCIREEPSTLSVNCPTPRRHMATAHVALLHSLICCSQPPPPPLILVIRLRPYMLMSTPSRRAHSCTGRSSLLLGGNQRYVATSQTRPDAKCERLLAQRMCCTVDQCLQIFQRLPPLIISSGRTGWLWHALSYTGSSRIVHGCCARCAPRFFLCSLFGFSTWRPNGSIVRIPRS